MTREYILMNQTLPVLRFSCERNAFDEPEFAEIEWLSELRPIGYGNLSDFRHGAGLRQQPGAVPGTG